MVAFELAALLAAVHFLASPSTAIFAYCDSTAALSVAIRGYSRSADLCHLVQDTWMLLAERMARFEIYHVRSEANVADGPSRNDLQLASALGARHVPWQWPSQWGRCD